MKPFHYFRPDSLPQAVDLLAEHGSAARLLAGGTDVIVRMRLGHLAPEVVIDVKRIQALEDGVSIANGSLRIGARCVMTDLAAHPRIREYFPALVESSNVVGSVQIRNRATLAGNVCNASPAADTVPALLVYGARVNAIGPAGERTVPLEDFLKGPGQTALASSEIVTSIDLPVPVEPTGSKFGRVTRRWGVDLATVNLCGLVTASGKVRFAYGAVGPKAFVVGDETGRLASGEVSPEEVTNLIQHFISHAAPRTDVRGGRDYRLAMLKTMSARVLNASHERLRADTERRARLQ